MTGRPSASIVRHRRPDGSRNTAASAVVLTASVAARVTAERLRTVNDLLPHDLSDPSSHPHATVTGSSRNGNPLHGDASHVDAPIVKKEMHLVVNSPC